MLTTMSRRKSRTLGELQDAHDSGSQRHVNREDTAPAWHIPDGEVTAVRAHGLARTCWLGEDRDPEEASEQERASK